MNTIQKVTMHKFLNLPRPQFLIYKIKTKPISLSFYKDERAVACKVLSLVFAYIQHLRTSTCYPLFFIISSSFYFPSACSFFYVFAEISIREQFGRTRPDLQKEERRISYGYKESVIINYGVILEQVPVNSYCNSFNN